MQILLSQKCLPSTRKQCTSCIRLFRPFRDSKTHWFWSSSLQVYRAYLTRRGMSTLRKAIYENSTGRTQQPGPTIHSMKSKSMGSFGLNFTLSLPRCITASQLVPKFKTLRCWYLSQPRKPLSQLEFYDWRKGRTSRPLMGKCKLWS